MAFQDSFDVIVVGGGHAGTEAALASARMGARTLLVSHSVETLGQMSCNPAIGGIGKTHLLREVDALGGAMARATDKAGIQFRVLNASKGPAVRATRAQADRVLYKAAIRTILENQPNLRIFQQAIDDLIVEGDQVKGGGYPDRIEILCTSGGADDWHIPGRQDPCRAQKPFRRSRRRSAVDCTGAALARTTFASRPPQDRNTAAAGRAHRRFFGNGRAAGRYADTSDVLSRQG